MIPRPSTTASMEMTSSSVWRTCGTHGRDLKVLERSICLPKACSSSANEPARWHVLHFASFCIHESQLQTVNLTLHTVFHFDMLLPAWLLDVWLFIVIMFFLCAFNGTLCVHSLCFWLSILKDCIVSYCQELGVQIIFPQLKGKDGSLSWRSRSLLTHPTVVQGRSLGRMSELLSKVHTT